MLRSSPIYRHALANTPVERPNLVVQDIEHIGFRRKPSGSASTLQFSRPAQRSLHVTACLFAKETYQLEHTLLQCLNCDYGAGNSCLFYLLLDIQRSRAEFHRVQSIFCVLRRSK